MSISVDHILLVYVLGVVLNMFLMYIMFTYSKNRLNPSTLVIFSALFPMLSFIGTIVILLILVYNKFKDSRNKLDSKFSFHRKNSHLILLTGKKGSGKSFIATTISNIVVPLGFTVARISFATPLKQILLRYYGIKKEMHSQKIQHNIVSTINIDKGTRTFIKENPFNLEPEQLERFKETIPLLISKYYASKLTNRELMQQVGDFFREHVSQNFFVDIVKEHISLLNQYIDIIIIDDLRFLNEDIREQINIPTTVIKVRSSTNDGESSDSQHISETEMDLLQSDFVIINDKTEDSVNKPVEGILYLTVLPNLIKEG